MKSKRTPLNEKIQKLPFTKLCLIALLLWLPVAVYVLNNFTQVDQLTFLLFSPLGSIALVWGTIYLLAFMFGYGITNTPTYPGARTLNNMELIKPEVATIFEKILLFIISSIILAGSILLFVFSIFVR